MKRILTYLIAFILMFCVFLVNVNAEENENTNVENEGTTIAEVQGAADGEVQSQDNEGESESTVSEEAEPEHEKTLTDNEDGTYTLGLTVKGETEEAVSYKKINVVVMLDTSNSMNDAGGTTVTYTETTSTSSSVGTQYGLINGEYVALTKRGHGNNSTFWYGNTQYTGTRYLKHETSESRLQAAKDAVNSLIESLLSNNGGENQNDTVEVALVTFSTTASVKQQPTTSFSTFQRTINGISASGGTNWEAALKSISNVRFNDNDQTYVIFVSDGNPTFYSTNSGHNDYYGNGVYGNGQEQTTNIERSYTAAVDDAKAIVNSGAKFYTIGAYGNVDRMENLTEASGAPKSNYYSAINTVKLQEALNSILQDIESEGFGKIVIKDGTTSNVTTTTGISHLLVVDDTSFKYYKNGVEWEDAPEATLNSDGEVVWNLGTGLLEDDVVYKVTFNVWASQETLDLIADLKNGIIDYDDLDENITKYLIKTGDNYSLATNTVATLSYVDTRVRASDTKEVLYKNPDPAKADSTELVAISKAWDNSIDDKEKSPITINILKDEQDWYSVTLDENNNYKANINVAPGMILTNTDGSFDIKNPGHDFSFVEEGEETHNWELKSEIFHPMLVDGVLTMFVRRGTTAPEGVESYKLNDYYYVILDLEEGIAKITATNERRSFINITKTIANTTEYADQLFDFDINVVTRDNEDVCFYVKDEEENLVTDLVVANATAEVNEGTATGYYYATCGSTFTVSIKAGWNLRVINLLTDSTYTIEEVNIDPKFAFEKVNYNNESLTTKKVEGTIDATNTTYSYEYVNNNVATDIVVLIEWDDFDNLYNDRPTNVVLHLSDGTNELTQPAMAATRGLSWKYVYENVPLTDNNGNTITYVLTQDTVLGYKDAVITGSSAAGFTATNELLLTSATVVKVWDDNDNVEGFRPTSLTVTLSNNTTKELSDSNNWTATIEDLPAYVDGSKVDYTWTEGNMTNGYSLTDTKVEGTKTTLTNSRALETIDIVVTKVWDTDETILPPVTIILNGDGSKAGTIELNDNNDWTYTFTGLQKYVNREEIEYTVDEVEVDGYTTVITGDALDGFTITNTKVKEEKKEEEKKEEELVPPHTGIDDANDYSLFTILLLSLALVIVSLKKKIYE